MPHSKTASLTVSLPVRLFVLAIFLVFPASFVCAAEVEAEGQAQTQDLENGLVAEPAEDPAAAFSETDEEMTEPANEKARGDAMISDILATGFMRFEGLEQTSGCGPLGCPAPGRCKLSCHFCWTSNDCPLVGGLRQGCTGFCL